MKPYIESLPDAVILISGTGHIIAANSLAQNLFGYPADELLSRNSHELAATANRSEYTQWKDRFFQSREKPESDQSERAHSLRALLKDGREIDVDVRLSHFDSDVDGPCLLAAIREIPQVKKASPPAQDANDRDALTQLPDKKRFMESLEIAVENARTDGRFVSVLAIEIGQHRKIIDTLGREAGDEYLREMAGRISRIRRKQDTVARLAGDEFGVMIDNLGDPGPAGKLASRVQGFLSAPVYIGTHSFAPRPGIGISMFPTDASDAVGLLRNADLAMRAAKGHEHGGISFFSEHMGEQAKQRLTLEGDLRSAIFKDEFAVHFQPIFETASGKLAGVESLLRWQHPKMGTIELQDFAQIADETGMSAPLGETALWLTFEAIRKWKAMGHWPFRVMHSLSPVQLSRSDALLRQLKGLLLDSQIDPRYVQFAIHESALPLNEKQQHTLLKIEELGIRLCVDGFGAGVSPLSYLSGLPVHAIKLAPALIPDATGNEDRQRVLSAFAQMAHSLDIEVVATGGNQQSHTETASAIGSDSIQGDLQCPILGFDDLCDRLFNQKPITRTNASAYTANANAFVTAGKAH